MPETTEQRQAWKKALEDAKPELERVGENVTIVYNANAPVLQWWRFDDIQNQWVEVANKRKTDPYHRQKFLEKGWRLSPPEDQVPVQAPAPIPAPTVDTFEVPEHVHRFGRAVGDVCRVEGCSVARKVVYRGRVSQK